MLLVMILNGIKNFLRAEEAISSVDFGCGEGDYVRVLLEDGFDSHGYDGNPQTPLITNGIGKILDLSTPFDLNRTFDWVISLEVGEHIPHQYETVFIENIVKHASRGVILSWAVKGQGGTGHFNEQNNDYIKSIFTNYGFINDLKAETLLREKASLGWFKNTILVFRK